MRGEKNATLPPPRGHGCERHHDDGIDLNLNERMTMAMANSFVFVWQEKMLTPLHLHTTWNNGSAIIRPLCHVECR